MGDPLGNPFHSASNAPVAAAPASTYDRDMPAPPPYRPSRTAAVESSRLPPPSDAMPPRHVASYEAPRAERVASIAAPSGHGSWSSAGGMSIVAGSGESAGVLAQRYNVPTEALLHANGFTSAAQVRPGTRLVIPVYSANGAASTRIASMPARDLPARDMPVHEHKGRERLMAKRDLHEHQEMAQRDRHEQRVARAEQAEEHGKMHWMKGPQPVKTARAAKGVETAEVETKVHGREKAMAHLEHKKVEKGMDVAEARPATRRTETAEVVEDKPQKVARLETPKKVAVDPTPTASLPPAGAEKVATAANGNPEFRWPARGRIIQGFKSGGNDGINIAVPEGTAVKAAESGVVAYAGSEIKGFGNLVLIRHPNGYVTAYANNADLEVKRGEQVKRGQTIAKSGQSGNVASPQLHFELRKGSTPVDPTRYLAGL